MGQQLEDQPQSAMGRAVAVGSNPPWRPADPRRACSTEASHRTLSVGPRCRSTGAPGSGVPPRISDVADTFRTPKRRADRAGPHMVGGTSWRRGGGTVPPSNLAAVEPDLNTRIIHGAVGMSTSAMTEFLPVRRSLRQLWARRATQPDERLRTLPAHSPSPPRRIFSGGGRHPPSVRVTWLSLRRWLWRCDRRPGATSKE